MVSVKMLSSLDEDVPLKFGSHRDPESGQWIQTGCALAEICAFRMFVFYYFDLLNYDNDHFSII